MIMQPVLVLYKIDIDFWILRTAAFRYNADQFAIVDHR